MWKILAVMFLVCLIAVPTMAGQMVRVTWNHTVTGDNPAPEGFKVYPWIDGVEQPTLNQDVVGATEPYSYEFDIGDFSVPILFKVEMSAYTMYAESIKAMSPEVTIYPPAPDAPYEVIVISITP